MALVERGLGLLMQLLVLCLGLLEDGDVGGRRFHGPFWQMY